LTGLALDQCQRRASSSGMGMQTGTSPGSSIGGATSSSTSCVGLTGLALEQCRRDPSSGGSMPR
jgi:hypothetical protein